MPHHTSSPCPSSPSLTEAATPGASGAAVQDKMEEQCVCPSVTTFSATTRNKRVKSDTNGVQRYTGFIFKMEIFVKVSRSEVMA